MEKIISYSQSNGVDGFILTNTSLDHNYNLSGGVSGKPLRQKSEESLKFVRSIVDDKAVIISSGGLMAKEDAIKRFSLKADLIQLYSGFVFKGNSLLQDCLDVSSTWQIHLNCQILKKDEKFSHCWIRSKSFKYNWIP